MIKEIEFHPVTCVSCGMVFCIPSGFFCMLRETENNFYCPSGHRLHFPDKDKVEKRQVIAEKERQERLRKNEEKRQRKEQMRQEKMRKEREEKIAATRSLSHGLVKPANDVWRNPCRLVDDDGNPIPPSV